MTIITRLIYLALYFYLLKDKKGVYIDCNKRFEDFFEATKKEILGKIDYDFIDNEQANFSLRMI